MQLDYLQLIKRDIVLFGINKFQHDIEIFFRELTVSSYLLADDAFGSAQKSILAKPVMHASECDKDSLKGALIVICAFETGTQERLLEGKGLICGVDFVRGVDLIRVVEQTETFYCACAHRGKKIIVLGTGAIATKLMLSNTMLNVAYFIDNDATKHGCRFFGREIFPVSVLAAERPEEYVVIVAASDIVALRKQLQEAGLLFGDDFYVYDTAGYPVRPCGSLEKTFAYYCAQHGFSYKNPCPVAVNGLGPAALHLTTMEKLPITIHTYACMDEQTGNGRTAFQGKEIRLLDDLVNQEHPPTLLLADDTAEAAAYLAAKGYAEGKDFFIYHPISDYSPAELLILTISDEPRYNVGCDYTARGMLITEDGAFAPCALMCKAYFGNVLYNSISRLMQSTGARIAWLSTVNKTYSFCFSICNQISNPESRMDHGFVPVMHENGEMPDKCERLNISYDASCNLACPSCRNHKIVVPQVDRSKLDLIHGEVKRALPCVRRLLDSYGEMFISRYMRELYQSGDIDDDVAYVLSNGLLFNRKNYSMLKERYKSIQAYFSIDAASKATYAKLRGGDFSMLLDQLHFAGELRKSVGLDYLCVIFVVQKDNFREMKDFVQLGFNIGADKVYFKVLTNRLGWTIQDFIENDVYNIDSSVHREFLELIRDPVFYDARVHLPLYHYRISDETYFLY
jgi:hypothetical protein